jgi:hypothetical protein
VEAIAKAGVLLMSTIVSTSTGMSIIVLVGASAYTAKIGVVLMKVAKEARIL